MASFDYDIGHKNAKNLAITIPSTVSSKTVRITDAGDKYAEAIYKSNGYYKQLANAFEKIAKHCNTAINNSKINVKGTQAELKQAKKTCIQRKTWSDKRREEAETKYLSTKDLWNLINK